MTFSLVNADKILNCHCCKYWREKYAHFILDKDGGNLHETVQESLENMTIVMEIYKLFGSSLNAVTCFKKFKEVVKKGKKEGKLNGKETMVSYTSNDIRDMYIVAL
jgi:hypothetical protein